MFPSINIATNNSSLVALGERGRGRKRTRNMVQASTQFYEHYIIM